MFVRIKRIAKRRRKKLGGLKRPGRTRSVTVVKMFLLFKFSFSPSPLEGRRNEFEQYDHFRIVGIGEVSYAPAEWGRRACIDTVLDTRRNPGFRRAEERFRTLVSV